MRTLKKILRLNSIKTRMILYFMGLIAIIVLFLSLASFQNAVRDAETLSINYTMRMVGEVNSSIDSYINNMKSMSTVVVENSDVRELMAFYNRHRNAELTENEQDELDGLKLRAATHMDTVLKTRGDITNIAVISKYGDIVLSDVNKAVNPYSEYNLTDWFLKPMSYKDDIVVSPSHVQNLIQGEYKWVISISKAIFDPETGEVTGVMLVDLNYRSIEEICDKIQFGKSGYIFIVDAKNNLIYHPQQQLVYSGIKSEDTALIFENTGSGAYFRQNEKNKIYVRDESETTGWSAIGVVNTAEFVSNRGYILMYCLVLAGLSILFSAVFAFMISTDITRPIKKLEGTMHRVEEGDFTVRAEIEQNDEIGHVSKTFNVMVQRIRMLMDNVVSQEEEKRKSEIKALQAQINPHFLYNTLETIIWMSASGKHDEVAQVTSALAQLFRTSISQGDSLVALSVELENIESYLTIQKMRYKNKLKYSIDFPDELQKLMIPKLVLQPIVENAIYHGIKPMPVGGDVSISGRRENEGLVIEIRDTGVGMTGQQIENLFVEDDGKDSRSIGVLNVHNRIRLVFGEQYGLTYTSPASAGTCVEIRIPAVEGGDVPDA